MSSKQLLQVVHNNCNVYKYIVKSEKREMEALLLVVSDIYTLLYT